jgi:DNA-binding XRE family transcriptional regulator
MSNEMIPTNHDHPGDEDPGNINEVTLLPHQEQALEMMLHGMMDGEIAQKVGVTRQTVNLWRNKDDNFRAKLSLRRLELWDVVKEKMADMYTEALGVLWKNLKSEDAKIQMKAAIQIVNLHDLKDNLITYNQMYLKMLEKMKFLDEICEMLETYKKERAPMEKKDEEKSLEELLDEDERRQQIQVWKEGRRN